MSPIARVDRAPRLVGATGAGHLDVDARFQAAIELMGRRWSGVVVQALLPGPAGYRALLDAIAGIGDGILAKRLRELQRAGLVERLVRPGPPVRVSYRLTERGLRLRPVFAAIEAWAAEEAG